MNVKVKAKETNMMKAQRLYRSVKNKLQYAIFMAMLALYSTPAYADLTNPEQVTISKDAGNADAMFGKILGMVFEILRYAGAFMAVFGIVKLIMAINNDQPEQYKTSILMAGSGVVLFFLKNLAKNIGLIG